MTERVEDSGERPDHDHDPRGGTGSDEAGTAGESTPDASEPPDARETAPGEAEEPGPPAELGPLGILKLASAQGKRGVFIALTCGFIVSMCCLVTTCGGSAYIVWRSGTLNEARETIGAPSGWDVEDTSAWPWGAGADLSGPADAEAIASWLTESGADVTVADVADCLGEPGRQCTETFRFDTHDVEVTYAVSETDLELATATITVS